MNEKQIEQSFIEKCSKLSFQELSDYIEKCFDKLKTSEISTESVPINKETYEALINLLESKRKDLLSENTDSAGQRLREIAEREGRKYDVSPKQAQDFILFLTLLESAKKRLIALKMDEIYYDIKWNEFSRKVEGFDKNEEFSSIYTQISSVYRQLVNEIIEEKILVELRDVKTHSQYNCSHLSNELDKRISNYHKYRGMGFNKKRLFNWINILIQYLITATELNIVSVKNSITAYEQKKQLDIQDLKRKSELELKQKQRIKESIEKRSEHIANLKFRKEEIFDSLLPKLKVKKLSWRLLPKGQWTVEDIIEIFRNYTFKGWNNSGFDETRLRRIKTFLNPSICYVGEDEFQGYVVFCFDWTEKVVLECPIFGNAIYVIKRNWQEITKLSKREVRYKYPDQVTIVNHNNTWLERLRKSLES